MRVSLLITCAALAAPAAADRFDKTYAKHCADCHGPRMAGTGEGPALVDRPLAQGASVDAIAAYAGRHATGSRLREHELRQAAILIAERRAGLRGDPMTAAPLQLPQGAVTTSLQSFRVETVVAGLDRFSYAIAPLPDGRLVVSEKMRGLSVVSADGARRTYVEGTPATASAGRVREGLHYGVGWLLDVAPHPQFADNGWLYLHHTDLCSGCRRPKWFGLAAKSMNRIVRGRIAGDAWVDEQVLWRADESFYTPNPDLGAGGRIAFDDDLHVYFTVGNKAFTKRGIQNLSTPYGKVHRIGADGSIPTDNPFAADTGAIASIYSYGHRVAQGLAYDRGRDVIWSTEMGPRGGDEINRLRAGGNYGWPLRSRGLNYDGSPVGPADTRYRSADGQADGAAGRFVAPVVDLTPAPSVSNLVVYEGDAFPRWRGDLLVGTLKARALYRFRITDGRVVQREALLTGLARIRDIALDRDGRVLLLLEHEDGSRIVRLVPVAPGHDAQSPKLAKSTSG